MPKTTGNAGASKRGTSKQPAATVGPVLSSTEPNDAFSNFDPKTTFWNPQNARALVYASDLAYKEDPAFIKANANNWGFAEDRVSIIDVSDLRALIMGSDKAVVVAFRGTRPSELIDWMVDFEILQVPFTKYFAAPNVGGVHDGFARLVARGWRALQAEIVRCQDKGQSLWITGHSLGGALATMATAAFTFAARVPVNGLYTFGQPRIGDIEFCTQCDSHFGDCMFRFVNNEDIVTRIPPRIVPRLPLPDFYGHSGQLRYFDASGNLHTDEQWWNSFLLGVDVGFDKMRELLAGPIDDHDLIEGYAANIEKYLANWHRGDQLPP
jgi:triacylglycerol lipase